MVYTYSWVHDAMDDYGNDDMKSSFYGKCPICNGPREEVYYGGGVTKHECNNCAKNFITSITNDPND